MASEQDDPTKAIEAAEAILNETRVAVVGIPLGVAYDLGSALAIDTASTDKGGKYHKTAVGVLGKFETVVPEDLINAGREGYTGDLTAEVQLPLSFRDVEFLGQAISKLPTGKEIVEALPLNPRDRAELDGFRNRFMHSFLTLLDAYQNVGGKVNRETRRTMEENLS